MENAETEEIEIYFWALHRNAVLSVPEDLHAVSQAREAQ